MTKNKSKIDTLFDSYENKRRLNSALDAARRVNKEGEFLVMLLSKIKESENVKIGDYDIQHFAISIIESTLKELNIQSRYSIYNTTYFNPLEHEQSK